MGVTPQRHGAKFWLLAVGGGMAVVAVTAAILLVVGLLIGRSLDDAASTLGVAIIGLGPYVGLLVRADREKRNAIAEDA